MCNICLVKFVFLSPFFFLLLSCKETERKKQTNRYIRISTILGYWNIRARCQEEHMKNVIEKIFNRIRKCLPLHKFYESKQQQKQIKPVDYFDFNFHLGKTKKKTATITTTKETMDSIPWVEIILTNWKIGESTVICHHINSSCFFLRN